MVLYKVIYFPFGVKIFNLKNGDTKIWLAPQSYHDKIDICEGEMKITQYFVIN